MCARPFWGGLHRYKDTSIFSSLNKSLSLISKILFLYFFQEKIDLDFYPVSTCTPTETLSIHSDITVYNWLQTTCKKDGGCEVGVNELEFNQEKCIKETAKCAEPSSFRPNPINQSLAASDSVQKSSRRPDTSTQPQSTASSPTESVRTIATSDSVEKSSRRPDTSTQPQSTASSPTEPVRTIAMEERKPTISIQSDMRKTPLGYVLEEDVQTVNHMHTIIAKLDKEQTKEDM